jgi:hypothetical protein
MMSVAGSMMRHFKNGSGTPRAIVCINDSLPTCTLLSLLFKVSAQENVLRPYADPQHDRGVIW